MEILAKYWGFLVLAALSGSITAYGSYSEKVSRGTWWFIPVFMVFPILSNLLWLKFTSTSNDPAEKYIVAQWWDLTVLMAMAVIPPLLLGASMPSPRFWLGVSFIVTGALLVTFARH
jgi:uncharacterized membrane protein